MAFFINCKHIPVYQINVQFKNENLMKKILIILAMVVTGFALNARESSITVSGYCYDGEDGLPGVQITNSLNSNSSSSDIDGFYAISIPANRSCTLTYTCKGFSQAKKSVQSSSSDISDLNVSMSH